MSEAVRLPQTGKMTSSKKQYLNHFFELRSVYYQLCTERAEPTTPRLENTTIGMINMVDDLSIQKDLLKDYDAIFEAMLKKYAELQRISVEEITNREYAELRRRCCNIIMGKIQQWFGQHFSVATECSVGVCRGPPGYDAEPKWKVKIPEGGDYYNPAKVFAEIITGKIDRDVSQMTVGFRGSGKSWKDLTLSEIVAAWISWIRDGDPTIRGSKNYFHEDYIACILRSRADEVMDICEKYIVKLLDDISIAWGARDYATKDNKERNNRFTINRVDRQALFMGFPDLFMIDKVPRNIVSHYCEMIPSDELKTQFSWSEAKLFLMDKNFRNDQQLYRYPHYMGAEVQAVLYPPPSPELVKIYTSLRKKMTEMQNMKQTDEEKRIERIRNDMQQKPKKKQTAQLRAELLYPDYMILRRAGVSQQDALKRTGITYDQLQYWRRSNYLPVVPGIDE